MIYFLQADIIGRIKIGYTSKGRLEKRISALKTASPVPLRLLCTRPGTMETEARLHERFAGSRLHGEWFEATPDLVRYVARLQGRQASRPRKRKREHAAVTWLTAMFCERREIQSCELMRLAHEAGISKNALHSPSAMALPIRKIPSWVGGRRFWVWRAEDGWPANREESH